MDRPCSQARVQTAWSARDRMAVRYGSYSLRSRGSQGAPMALRSASAAPHCTDRFGESHVVEYFLDSSTVSKLSGERQTLLPQRLGPLKITPLARNDREGVQRVADSPVVF